MQERSLWKLAVSTLKGPAPWFMLGNGVANWQTHPGIAVLYAAALGGHTSFRYFSGRGAVFRRRLGDLRKNLLDRSKRGLSIPMRFRVRVARLKVLKFLAEDQGLLATSAGLTLAVGAATLGLGAPVLGAAMLCFGAANMGQAFTYARMNKDKRFKESRAAQFRQAACEVGMIFGFVGLGAVVGLSMMSLAGIAGLGVTFTAMRVFKWGANTPILRRLHHPDFAYSDMQVTAGLTLWQALATGSAALAAGDIGTAVGAYTIAASRVLAMGGVSRLAVMAASTSGARRLIPGLTSIYAVEEYPNAVRTRLLAFLKGQAGLVLEKSSKTAGRARGESAMRREERELALERLRSEVALLKAALGARRPGPDYAAMIRRYNSQRPRRVMAA